MNRRLFLLGTGTVLATTVAGCGSPETDEEDDTGEDEDADSFEDEVDTDDETVDDEAVDDEFADDDADTPDDDDGTETDERIPGFDAEAFDVDNEELTVEEITRDGQTVTVRAEADTLDQDALEDELAEAGREFAESIDDIDAFADAVSTVDWEVEYGGSDLASFHIESEWIVAYDNGELSRAELRDRIAETASMA